MRLVCASLMPPQVFILAVPPDDVASDVMPMRLAEVRLVTAAVIWPTIALPAYGEVLFLYAITNLPGVLGSKEVEVASVDIAL